MSPDHDAALQKWQRYSAFEKLMPVAKGSPAEEILWEVENTIISAIESVSADY